MKRRRQRRKPRTAASFGHELEAQVGQNFAAGAQRARSIHRMTPHQIDAAWAQFAAARARSVGGRR